MSNVFLETDKEILKITIKPESKKCNYCSKDFIAKELECKCIICTYCDDKLGYKTATYRCPTCINQSDKKMSKDIGLLLKAKDISKKIAEIESGHAKQNQAIEDMLKSMKNLTVGGIMDYIKQNKDVNFDDPVEEDESIFRYKRHGDVDYMMRKKAERRRRKNNNKKSSDSKEKSVNDSEYKDTMLNKEGFHKNENQTSTNFCKGKIFKPKGNSLETLIKENNERFFNENVAMDEKGVNKVTYNESYSHCGIDELTGNTHKKRQYREFIQTSLDDENKLEQPGVPRLNKTQNTK